MTFDLERAQRQCNELTDRFMNRVNFNRIWEDFNRGQLYKGELSIDDWCEMCRHLDTVCEEKNVDKPVDDDPMTDERHLFFLEGAKWGFKRASERSKEVPKFPKHYARSFSTKRI